MTELEHGRGRRRTSCSSATPTRPPYASVVEQLVADGVASGIAAAGRHPVGPGRRVRGGQAARLGRLPVETSRDARQRHRGAARSSTASEGLTRVVLCGMGGSSLAPEVICAAAGVELVVARLLRPRLRARRARGPAGRDRRRGLQQVRRHRRDRQPAARLREGVPRRRDRAGRADRGRDRPGLAAGEVGARGRLPRLPGRPGRRRPLLGAHGVRPGAQRAGRRRHRRRCSTRPRRSGRPWRPTTSTTPGCGSVACSVPPTCAGVDKVVLADAGSAFPGFGDWAEQLIAESTGKDGKGILPVVVDSLDAPNFDPSTPDEVLATFGPDFVFDTVRPASSWGATVDAPLGAQLLLWEYATVVAGRVIGINPFDQPDVESAKEAARVDARRRRQHAHAGVRGRSGDRLRQRGPAARGHRDRGRRRRRPCSAGSTRTTATSRSRPTSTGSGTRRWPSCAGQLAARTGRPVTFGWGPRFLHSTGQYHKGGPDDRRLPAGHQRPGGRPGRPGPAVHVPRVPHRPGRRRRAGARRPRPAGAAAARDRARPAGRRTQGPRVTLRTPTRCGRSAGPAAAADRGTVRDGALRRHRRPVPQEGDAGDLRPREPRAAAAGLQPHRLRTAGLGRPGLRAHRARLGQAARAHRVPRGDLEAAGRGVPVRVRGLRRRRRLRQPAPHHRGARQGARHGGQPRVLPRHPARFLRHRRRPAQGARAGPRRRRLVAPRGHREALRSRPRVRPRSSTPH